MKTQYTTEQRVRFAIQRAKEVCHDPEWNKWAERWLSGEDQGVNAAIAAYRATDDAAAMLAAEAAEAYAAMVETEKSARAAELAATAPEGRIIGGTYWEWGVRP